jgi:cytochrome c-type biogenesis protein CcmH/NrfG
MVIAALVVGFLGGILFSAWKLDVKEKPTNAAAKPPEAKMDSGHGEATNRIAGLEKIVEQNPNNVSALTQLANDYFDTQNYEKSVEYYGRVAKIDPRNADVLTDMAIAYRKLGKPNDAVATFRKALEVDPNHSLALFNLGIVLRDDVQDPAGALKVWEEFLQKAGDSRFAVMVRPWVQQLREKTSSTPQSSPAQ